jgi:hypothetical protein
VNERPLGCFRISFLPCDAPALLLSPLSGR